MSLALEREPASPSWPTTTNAIALILTGDSRDLSVNVKQCLKEKSNETFCFEPKGDAPCSATLQYGNLMAQRDRFQPQRG